MTGTEVAVSWYWLGLGRWMNQSGHLPEGYVPEEECTIFMDDTAPCHCAVVTTKELHGNSVNQLDQPAHSTILNPVETGL